MAFRELTPQERAAVFRRAVKRRLSISLSLRSQNQWMALRSRMLGLDDGLLWVEPPTEPGLAEPHEISSGERVGGMFRIEPHKYSFMTRPGEGSRFEGASALPLLIPEVVHATDRRMYPRLNLQIGMARASFWPGGKEAEPQGVTPERPIWSGRVADISINGIQIQTSPFAAQFLEPGDVVGVRLLFSQNAEPIYLNAQYRHAACGRNIASMGFQFAGLEQSVDGLEALESLAGWLEKLGL